jgi:hypothetical protein
VAAAPPLPPAASASFLQAYSQYNGTGSEAAVTALAAQLLADPGLQAFLALPDSFAPPGLDADMVLCAVLCGATPLGLAEYAVQGQRQQALVSGLLNDTLLMRDMLAAGGPAGGQYGQAAAILAAINQSSAGGALLPPSSQPGAPWDDRNQSTVLRRLALGTALAHAVPISVYSQASNVTLDPVARYLHYQGAYLAGELDPAFEVLTAFELTLVADSNGLDEDLLWLRTTMANYRPDYIARDYSWRYIQAVHQEVPYGDSQCPLYQPGVCNGHYSQIPVGGGVCGPRAFFSRFARKAFGLPTWGVTQPGHAAMSSWDPATGWGVQLGAGWQYGWWGPRSGEDFHLEAQARELRGSFQGVLRGGWVAAARGEAPVGQDWTPVNPRSYGKGGLWGALMLYAKKLAVAGGGGSTPPRAIGPSVVPTRVAALLAAWPQQWPKPNITTDPATGITTIPAAAYAAVNRSAAVAAMKSYDLLGQQVVVIEGNYLDPQASAVTYELPAAQAGVAYLTANFSTWHIDIDLLVQVNGGALQALPVYLTFGYWNQSQPVQVQLQQGSNVLAFMRSTEAAAPMAIKEYLLYPSRPDFPAPPSNYTPPAPAPRPNRFIEVPADTTCAKQGISDVPANFCQQACEALGIKYAGGKARMNMTGCMVLDSGGAGLCTYNTNTSATVCPQQPCTSGGSVAQQVCLR